MKRLGFSNLESPSGQNAPLPAGIEKETEGVTLVSTRHSAPQLPLHPYRCWIEKQHEGRHEDPRRALEWADVCAPSGRANAKRWSLGARTCRNSHSGPTHPDRNAAGCRRLSLLLWQVRPPRSTATSKTPLDRSIAIVVNFSMDISFSVSLRLDYVGTQMPLHVMKDESTSSLQRPNPRALAWLGPSGRAREFQG